MGIAAYPAHGESAEALFAHADIAMYLAKRSGGNRALVWYPEMERQWRETRPA
jgi:predicted signal transduction protein with EAL and GGDEF domain